MVSPATTDRSVISVEPPGRFLPPTAFTTSGWAAFHVASRAPSSAGGAGTFLPTRTFFCCASGRPTARPSDNPVSAATNPTSIARVRFIVDPPFVAPRRSSAPGLVDRQTDTRNVPSLPAHSRRVQRLVLADVSGDRVAVGVTGQQTHVPGGAVAAAIAMKRIEHAGNLARRSMRQRRLAGEARGIERRPRLAETDAATHLRRDGGRRRVSPPAPGDSTAQQKR